MKWKNLLCPCLLTLLLALGLAQPAAAFSPEPAQWASESCQHLQNEGLLDWRLSTEKVDPTTPIKRGEFCTLLVNLIQMEGAWDKTGEVLPKEQGFFSDLQENYHTNDSYAMHWGACVGLTEGTLRQDGTRVAGAQDNLTREQAAKMMCALMDALETYGGLPAPQRGPRKTFQDQQSISPWATEFVARAAELGILQGDSQNRFLPNGTLTWQEACVMVDRVYRSAEQTLTAQNQQQGISRKQSELGYPAGKSIGTGYSLYALEYNGTTSLLSVSAELPMFGDQSRIIEVERYRADGSSAGIQTIPMELEQFAAFYEGSDFYYLVFGQENTEQNNSKTVYRVVQYDKNWNRRGAADISNCFTSTPFLGSTHTGLSEQNGILVLHTARERYVTSDGLRHQSNFTAKIRTSDMSVISTSGEYPSNHVSHSFSQYVAFDEGNPVYVDQGDAYPRGFCLSVENSQGESSQRNLFPFSGSLGDNETNALPGGLGVSASHYLFAGASSPQQGNDSLTYANVFLSVAPKNSTESQYKWLTNFPAGGKEYVNDVRLVQVDRNTFVVMWQSTRPGGEFDGYGPFQYAVFDGQGNQVGQTQSLSGYVLPTDAPSVYGNRIVWARPELDSSRNGQYRDSRFLQFFQLEIPSNGASASQTPEPPATTDQWSTPSTEPAKPAEPSDNVLVNGIPLSSIQRDPILSDGEKTKSYRESWGDGQWMQLSLTGTTVTLSGQVNREGRDYALLEVVYCDNKSEVPITPDAPFTVELQLHSDTLEVLRRERRGFTCGTYSGEDQQGRRYGSGFPTGTRFELGFDENGELWLWAYWTP